MVYTVVQYTLQEYTCDYIDCDTVIKEEYILLVFLFEDDCSPLESIYFIQQQSIEVMDHQYPPEELTPSRRTAQQERMQQQQQQQSEQLWRQQQSQHLPPPSYSDEQHRGAAYGSMHMQQHMYAQPPPPQPPPGVHPYAQAHHPHPHPNEIMYHHQQQQQPPPPHHYPQNSMAYAATAASVAANNTAVAPLPPPNYYAATPNYPPVLPQQQQPQQPPHPHVPYVNMLPVPPSAVANNNNSKLIHQHTRPPSERPLVKLSVSLIDTYKHINTIYYQERDARRAQRAKEKSKTSTTATTAAAAAANSNTTTTTGGNNGWDDENYDYIVTPGELFYGRYKMIERIGKGSFGQVVRAEDVETKREVAIKIIKSKKPFLLQAKTEIELLTVLFEKDPDDQHNLGKKKNTRRCMCACASVFYQFFSCYPFLSSIALTVRLLTHFMYRNHQCLVFEMLSLNLYELLKNTQFGGVSLNLIKKFAKQVLKALTFLARRDVDIIHCDLKPENILLRHPKKSAVKVIDFGSSCRTNKRMYSYIQSRFYRSPEVMLGLPYSVAIDIWSLGCILAEMHTGEPLFSGTDQFDQMQKIVKLLGMVPDSMLDKAPADSRKQFFEKVKIGSGEEWQVKQSKPQPSSSKQAASEGSTSSSPVSESTTPVTPSTDPIASLSEVITAGSRQKKKYPPSEAYNSQRNYELFIDLVYKMLAYRPEDRITPTEALQHPFLASSEPASQSDSPSAAANTTAAASSSSPSK